MNDACDATWKGLITDDERTDYSTSRRDKA